MDNDLKRKPGNDNTIKNDEIKKAKLGRYECQTGKDKNNGVECNRNDDLYKGNEASSNTFDVLNTKNTDTKSESVALKSVVSSSENKVSSLENEHSKSDVFKLESVMTNPDVIKKIENKAGSNTCDVLNTKSETVGSENEPTKCDVLKLGCVKTDHLDIDRKIENEVAGNKCDASKLNPGDSNNPVSVTESEDSNLQNNNGLDFEGVPITNSDGTPIFFNGVEVTKLTKTQLKKYKRALKWAAGKKEKRARERQKMKNKIKEAKLNNRELGPSRKSLKKVTMATSSCKMNVVIDMSFDELMINKDIGKVIKQTLRVYTKNRRSLQPMQLHLTNFDGRVKEEMSKHDGYDNWDINFHQVSYLDLFPKEKLVYLSSESENVITKLEDDKVYIIGGLVDHNSHKGICHKKAVEQGISHGQLPISEYFRFQHRKVFTINQVFEILLEVSQGKSFKEAFQLTLPKRINMQPTSKDEDDDSAGAEETETVENL